MPVQIHQSCSRRDGGAFRGLVLLAINVLIPDEGALKDDYGNGCNSRRPLATVALNKLAAVRWLSGYIN